MLHRACVGIGVSLTVAFCLAGTAAASVSVRVSEFHEYEIEGEGPHLEVRVTGDGAADEIALSLREGRLEVNDADPQGKPLDFKDVARLWVRAGGGDDSVDLSEMRGFSAVIHDELGVLGNLLVNGGAGEDLLTSLGTDADDLAWLDHNGLAYLQGGDDDDLLIGSPARDSLNGGKGDDRIFGRAAADFLQGSQGNDRLYGEDNEKDGRNRDVLLGGTGDDWLFGGRGDDLLVGKLGRDMLIGGPGRDTMYQKTQSRRWPGGCDEAPLGMCNPIIG